MLSALVSCFLIYFSLFHIFFYFQGIAIDLQLFPFFGRLTKFHLLWVCPLESCSQINSFEQIFLSFFFFSRDFGAFKLNIFARKCLSVEASRHLSYSAVP